MHSAEHQQGGEGMELRLRSVSPQDAAWLFAWYCDFESGFFWHVDRRVLSFDQFVARLNSILRTSELRIAVDSRSDKPVACCLLHSLRSWDAWSHLAIYVEPSYRDPDTLHRVAQEAARFSFAGHPTLRKVYVETYGFASYLDKALEDIGFVEEGVTPGHFWFGDSYWARRRMALYQDAWRQDSERRAPPEETE